ncbi:hypothetical protein [Absidia glauca]|uniref:Uncharacterized protein n=1 Tax=Absidia glauca TaxID=4829 RepID=A0A163IQF9_ABSGL|nr:hypothetical protein [Absidia glauca]
MQDYNSTPPILSSLTVLLLIVPTHYILIRQPETITESVRPSPLLKHFSILETSIKTLPSRSFHQDPSIKIIPSRRFP